jgi:hypothetical protein
VQNLENLKDTILQTIHEIEDSVDIEEIEDTNYVDSNENEIEFYNKLRDRLLVLFEGLQSPNINSLDKKLDLTINFLEYTLALLDQKLSK